MLSVLNAIAGIGTLVLLAATAVAGLIQIRHMRAANELAALLAIERDFREPGVQEALAYVAQDLRARLDDAGYRAQLARPGYIDAREHPEMTLCNWFNRAGALVRRGLVNDELFFRSFGRLVTYYWDLLAPVVAIMRRARGSAEYAGFEYLAARAAARVPRARRNTPARAPVADPWLDDDRRADAAP